jgi:hypothetical protein
MKKTIAFLILLISNVCLPQSTLNSQNKVEWKSFSNKNYSINYPAKWQFHGGKIGFYTGQKAKFYNAEWMLVISKARNKERVEIFFTEDEDLYKGYKKTKKPISIDAIKGFHYTYTKGEEYIETILLKTKKIWFKFTNNEVKDKKFETFYKSFNYKKN